MSGTSTKLVALDADSCIAAVATNDAPARHELQAYGGVQSSRPTDRYANAASRAEGLLGVKQNAGAADVDGLSQAGYCWLVSPGGLEEDQPLNRKPGCPAPIVYGGSGFLHESLRKTGQAKACPTN